MIRISLLVASISLISINTDCLPVLLSLRYASNGNKPIEWAKPLNSFTLLPSLYFLLCTLYFKGMCPYLQNAVFGYNRTHETKVIQIAL